MKVYKLFSRDTLDVPCVKRNDLLKSVSSEIRRVENPVIAKFEFVNPGITNIDCSAKARFSLLSSRRFGVCR